MFSPVTPLVTLGEAQAFLRLGDEQDEAFLAGLIRTASELCEGFLDQAIIVRPFREQLPASSEWQYLCTGIVRSVTSVKRVAGFAAAEELAVGSYEIDLDAAGRACLRLVDPTVTGRIEVVGTAGFAWSQHEVPEPIRHGVLRMVGHLFASRDGAGGEPPAMVTALWRPYRRLGLIR